MIKKLLLILAMLLLLSEGPAYAANYPGVYTSQDTLVFIRAEEGQGNLQGIVVLSYQYSMDWIITTATSGRMVADGLSLTNGNQYVYQADGKKLSESEFSSMELNLELESFQFQLMPSYGYLLAPMVRGGLAYALIENHSGLPSQIALAREAYETAKTVNLYEGFLYQISNGKISAQVNYTEIAFGNEGLTRANFPSNFPPPPEDYPVPYPSYPTPSYSPPAGSSGPSPGGTGFFTTDPLLPQGKPVDPEVAANRPKFTLEAMHDYDYREIKKIGIVQFRDTAKVTGYGPTCDQLLQDKLASIEGIEVVYIPWDEAKFGGAVMWDRAVWLCNEYGVDALIMSELDDLDIPGGDLLSSHYQKVTRIQITIKSKLIEGTGGSTAWQGEFEADNSHDTVEVEKGIANVIKGDLGRVINKLVTDITDKGVLAGGHVE